MKTMFCKMLLILALLFGRNIKNMDTLCLVKEPPTCLSNLEEEDAKGVLNYVLQKYEEVEMKITGEPLAVRGKRITSAGTEEVHIAFTYVDNTPGDVIQNCVFVVLHKPGECENISVVCNTYLRATPRPLLKREDLTVCDDGEEQAAQATQQTQEMNT